MFNLERHTVIGITPETARQISADLDKVLPFLPEGCDPEVTHRLQRLAQELRWMEWGNHPAQEYRGE